MRVYGAPLLTLSPVSQMIPDARHEVAPLALASRKKGLDDAHFPPFLLRLILAMLPECANAVLTYTITNPASLSTSSSPPAEWEFA